MNGAITKPGKGAGEAKAAAGEAKSMQKAMPRKLQRLDYSRKRERGTGRNSGR